MIKMMRANTVAMVLVAVIFYTPLSRAQVSLQDLKPTNSFKYVYVDDSSIVPEIFDEPQFGRGLFYLVQFNSVADPLTKFDAKGEERQDIVDKVSTLALGVWWAKGEKVGFGADFALSTVNFGERSNETGWGDSHFRAEWLLKDWRKESYGASIEGGIYLPTGEKDKFLSNESLGLEAGLNLEKRFKFFSAAVSAHYLRYFDAEYRNINLERQLLLGGALRFPIGQTFALNLEGAVTYLVNEGDFSGPGEVYLGGSHSVAYNGSFYWGAGVSHVESDSSTSIRTVAGYKFLPGAVKPREAQSSLIIEKETIKIIDRCGPEPSKRTFSARRLTDSELNEYRVLPYQSSNNHKIAVKQIGQMTSFTQGLPYVSDTQILFAVDLKGMPSKRDLINMKSARLRMQVRKVSADNSKDTELLCILNNKVCSGELFAHPDWRGNINQEFFHDKETPNDYFTKQYLNQSIQIIGGKHVFAGDLIIDIEKVIENSLVRGIQPLFYKDDGQPLSALYFVVADDTYISNNVQLEVDLVIDTCKTNQIKTEVETKKETKTEIKKEIKKEKK